MGKFQIYAPREARTKDSILLLWDKVNDGAEKLQYDIYVNGKLCKSVDCTDETLTGLEPASEYTVQVVTQFEGELYDTDKIRVSTRAKGNILDITQFGADVQCENNAEAIQKAIDACGDGDTVYIPEGIFRSGALFLHSNMTLEVAEGARLQATGKVSDFEPFFYPYEGRWEMCYASLLNVRTLPEYNKEGNPQTDFDIYENIKIIGKGVIDGGGEDLFKPQLDAFGKVSRSRTICIRNTTGLYIYGVTVRNSAAWCLHNIYCKNMTINQISLFNKFDENGNRYTHFNGDGIDPDSCQDVTICHSFIESQDDSIALKSGREPLGLELAIPTQKVRISNCKLSYGFGVVVGSEMSGGINDVLIQDIEMNETFCAVNLKTRHGRGACISNISYENIKQTTKMVQDEDDKWFRGNLCIDQFYGDDSVDAKTKLSVDKGTSTIKDISIRNVVMDVNSRKTLYMCGLPENPVNNVLLENVSATGGEGAYIKNIKKLKMVNCDFNI